MKRDRTLGPRLTAWLAEHPWSSPAEIIAGLGQTPGSYETVRSCLANLYLRGLAEWKYVGGRNSKVWRVTEDLGPDLNEEAGQDGIADRKFQAS